jgi:hypothetical protein
MSFMHSGSTSFSGYLFIISRVLALAPFIMYNKSYFGHETVKDDETVGKGRTRSCRKWKLSSFCAGKSFPRNLIKCAISGLVGMALENGRKAAARPQGRITAKKEEEKREEKKGEREVKRSETSMNGLLLRFQLRATFPRPITLAFTLLRRQLRPLLWYNRCSIFLLVKQGSAQSLAQCL